VEKDGNIWYITELIDDEPWNDALLDMFWFFEILDDEKRKIGQAVI
jgi:hypothetical protein